MSASKLDPGAKRTLAFTLLYLGLVTPYALLSANYEFVLYIAVVGLMIPALALVHLRVRLPEACLWAFSAWGLIHMAGGLVPVPEAWPIHGDKRVLYSLWLIPDRLKYDHVVHAYGFGLVAYTSWVALSTLLSRAQDGAPVHPTLGLLTLSVASGCGFGALNEVVEFAATLLIPETNVGGYVNTGWDLVANLAGGLAVALVIRLRGPRSASSE